VVDFEDGCRLISAFVEYSNTHRLHSAIGYLTPVDKLNGREALISRQREDKKKYIEETIERKRSHIKECSALLPERDSKARHPSRAQLDPGTVLSPFKVLGSFLYHQKPQAALIS
jgi:hypothetical protein